jgi:hypothetical protein
MGVPPLAQPNKHELGPASILRCRNPKRNLGIPWACPVGLQPGSWAGLSWARHSNVPRIIFFLHGDKLYVVDRMDANSGDMCKGARTCPVTNCTHGRFSCTSYHLVRSCCLRLLAIHHVSVVHDMQVCAELQHACCFIVLHWNTCLIYYHQY